MQPVVAHRAGPLPATSRSREQPGAVALTAGIVEADTAAASPSIGGSGNTRVPGGDSATPPSEPRDAFRRRLVARRRRPLAACRNCRDHANTPTSAMQTAQPCRRSRCSLIERLSPQRCGRFDPAHIGGKDGAAAQFLHDVVNRVPSMRSQQAAEPGPYRLEEIFDNRQARTGN